MLRKGSLGTKREKKMHLLPVPFVNLPNMQLNRLVTDDDPVFVGKFTQLDDKLRGMRDVNREHTEKHSDKKGKRKIL